ncbi:tetratricopeptide repeat protein [Nonlabens antarcticus]|uniref:tetratricopeptide repeat protein n=1 Tax=Nonlabens antarcticus TaxID=392714 RepID=UPI0018913861|nr:tetratricopeptide repeat protein [Nonlabens antarcticus]
MKNLFLVLSFISCSVACGQSAFAKAESLYKQNNYKAALPIYTKLLQEDPTDAKLLRATGQTYGKLEDFEAATAIYKRLLATDDNNADYHFFYGGAMGMWAKNASKFKALGLLDDVKMHLKQAADLDPKHIEVRWALVQLYTELPGIIGGSLSTARKYATQLQRLSPVDGYLATGYIEEYDKEYDDAEKAYKNAIKVGGSSLTYLKLANLYSDKMDREADAKTTLETAYKIHKDPKLLAEIEKLNS